MTATDELRRMLDERGVEYETYIEQPTGFEHVKWNFNEHGSADFNLEFGEPWLTMYGTISGPAQAIEATLGRGECHDEGTFHSWGYFTCSNCKVVVPVEAVREAPSIGKVVPISFCPNCGRRVVEVDA